MLSSSSLDRKTMLVYAGADNERHLTLKSVVQDGPSVSSFFILLTSSALAASLSFKVCISTLCWWTVFLGTSWHSEKGGKKDVASEPRDAVLEKKLFWLKELIPLSLPASKNQQYGNYVQFINNHLVETAIRDWLEALVSMAPTIHWHIRPPFASTCYK